MPPPPPRPSLLIARYSHHIPWPHLMLSLCHQHVICPNNDVAASTVPLGPGSIIQIRTPPPPTHTQFSLHMNSVTADALLGFVFASRNVCLCVNDCFSVPFSPPLTLAGPSTMPPLCAHSTQTQTRGDEEEKKRTRRHAFCAGGKRAERASGPGDDEASAAGVTACHTGSGFYMEGEERSP